VTRQPDRDKAAEQSRYDSRALRQSPSSDASGAASLHPVYQAPYLYYERAIRENIGAGDRVLELGAGTGLHSRVLLETGARVTATDIAPSALTVLRRTVGDGWSDCLTTAVADMESLPFPGGAFDAVTCAGSLSYGDPETVDAEVRRVLRAGGRFICVDSLNHNPIYRFNRYLRYLRGERTLSTLRRMPTLERIRSIASHFSAADVRYVGGISWVARGLAPIVGVKRATALSDACDALLRTKRSAFKFVMVARGRV
jgi:ubiquinone/menaquinone biosynthesis C-methylase UbiE